MNKLFSLIGGIVVFLGALAGIAYYLKQKGIIDFDCCCHDTEKFDIDCDCKCECDGNHECITYTFEKSGEAADTTAVDAKEEK